MEAIDQRHGDEQGQAGAQRQHDRAREAAGRAEVADRQCQLGPARPRHAPGRPGDGAAQAEEHGEHADDAQAVVEREQARLGREDRQRRQQQGRAPAVSATMRRRGSTRSGATSSRNSTPARTCSARPSGHSVNSSDTRKP